MKKNQIRAKEWEKLVKDYKLKASLLDVKFSDNPGGITLWALRPMGHITYCLSKERVALLLQVYSFHETTLFDGSATEHEQAFAMFVNGIKIKGIALP